MFVQLRTLALSWLVGSFALLAEHSALAQTPGDVTTIGPVGRPALIKLPASQRHQKKRPLLLVLHGYNMDAQVMDNFVQASAAATALNAYLVMPNGRVNPEGKRFWDATDACCNFYGVPATDMSDEDYLMALVKEAREKYSIDKNQIYVIGFSNGAFMANRLACNHSEVFSGLVSISGVNYADASKCEPKHALSVLQIHGTMDPVIAYNGGQLTPYTAAFPSAGQSALFWAQHNRCEEQNFVAAADELSYFNIDLSYQIPSSEADLFQNYSSFGKETDTLTYSECRGDAKVGLWTMNGLGHAPYYKADTLIKAINFVTKRKD